MKILLIGDIVASPGREAVVEVLPGIKAEIVPDLTIANAENLAHGRGVTVQTISKMQEAGIDYFTSGDHVFWQKGTADEIDTLPIIRPANYPKGVPGIGHKLLDLGKHGNVLLINLMGRTFLSNSIDDPFRKADEILNAYTDKDVALTIVDFHAEATSEKQALGFYLDGRVDIFVGTHTHIPTCDHRILPKNTYYVTDLGMTGNIDSVLGVKTEIIQKLFLTGMNQRFEWESTGKKAFRSVIIDTDKKTIDRLDKYL